MDAKKASNSASRTRVSTGSLESTDALRGDRFGLCFFCETATADVRATQCSRSGAARASERRDSFNFSPDISHTCIS